MTEKKKPISRQLASFLLKDVQSNDDLSKRGFVRWAPLDIYLLLLFI
jgi:hypothetical protein